MDTISQVCALLQKKRDLFSEFEQAAIQMLECDIDDIQRHMNRRLELQAEISELDRALAELCGGNKTLLQASGARCSRESLAAEYCPVFDAAMEIHALLNRLRELEPLVADRVQTERATLLEKIKEINQGQEPTVSKYYKSIRPEMPTSSGRLGNI